MITWMNHPEHGYIPVYDNATVKFNKEQGWVVCEEPKPEVTEDAVAIAAANARNAKRAELVAALDAALDSDDSTVDEIKAARAAIKAHDQGPDHDPGTARDPGAEADAIQERRTRAIAEYERLFHKKPHGMMKIETIEKAVAEGTDES